MHDTDKLSPPPISLIDGAALFLDFDGTLVDLAPRPEDVIVPDSLFDMINDLNRLLKCRIAIVSGRSVQVLRQDFNMSEIAIAGSHGNEISLVGNHDSVDRSEKLDQIIAELNVFASQHNGLLIEAKSMGVGLHFRGAPDLESICKVVAFALAEKYDLKVQAGKMLFEIYSGDEDKGSAIKKLCALQPFSGSKPIFIGDDKTDEHGFQAAAELGGTGILVGPDRSTAARYRLDDVPAVHAWLSAVIISLIKDKM